jgi:3-phenylpropionate/trans-cinnamate dioxygenase ferredoxin reductase subunit
MDRKGVLMKHYKYLIIGGGMTADSAAKAIRKIDKEGTVGMFSMESHPPYKRPPLTKGLWTGKDTPEKIWLNTEEKNVDIYLNHRIEAVDPNTKTVQDSQGENYSYDKLLLSTGGVTRKLPFGEDNILYYRIYDHYQMLRQKTHDVQAFAVIGGGFIGSELAAALTMNNKKATIIFPEDGIGGAVFPPELSAYLNDFYRSKGVEVLNGEMVKDLEIDQQKLIIKTGSGEVEADFVVGGIGIKPNTRLAESADIKVDNGILVNENLLTNKPDIYAAGDVASIFNTILDRNMRYEHEDNAIAMGDVAGQNMAGKPTRYDSYLPYFYSDLFELGYEAVGVLNSKLEMYADWQEKYKKGVIYYLQDGSVKGVLLWNVWGQVDAARSLIAETKNKPVELKDLAEKLPEAQ